MVEAWQMDMFGPQVELEKGGHIANEGFWYTLVQLFSVTAMLHHSSVEISFLGPVLVLSMKKKNIK